MRSVDKEPVMNATLLIKLMVKSTKFPTDWNRTWLITQVEMALVYRYKVWPSVEVTAG